VVIIFQKSDTKNTPPAVCISRTTPSLCKTQYGVSRYHFIIL